MRTIPPELVIPSVIALLVIVVLIAIVVFVVGSLAGWWAKQFTVEKLIAFLEPHIRVYKPEGEGPFPAVLQLHGCGGAKEIQDEYAVAARDAGVLVLILDSLTPRGIGFDEAVRRVCTGRVLRGRERAGDLVAGLEMLRRRPDVDPDQLAVVGWSHGGWTIMDLLALDIPHEKPFNLRDVPRDPWKGVKAIELIYPFAGFPSLTRERGWKRTDIPCDVLVIKNDTVAPNRATYASLEKARQSGAELTVETWEGVTHAFEESVHTPGSKLRYNPERAAEAHARYANWVKDVFGLGAAAPAPEVPASEAVSPADGS
ncbi:MAG: dienelactone hydrolase family protein [Maricaulaceae bacterium]|jgi:dienelactone hydrolase